MSVETYTKSDLEKFKSVQQLAYKAVTYVRGKLKEGMSEKEASTLIDKYLRENGADGFFHYGFAWFGDRTSFTGFKRPLLLPGEWIEKLSPPHFGLEFMPTNRKLQKGMTVILDVAPVVQGYAADIGYAFAFGENAEVDKALMDLEIFRSEILKMVLAEKTMSKIYQETDSMITEMGYKNCHAVYPMGVLGHKVGKIPMTWLPPTKIMGFQVQTFAYLLKQVADETLNGALNKSPLWSEKANSKPDFGLWAVEPHIGKGEIGVKWEELLVVTSSTAYWLDNDLPHVNFWKESQLQNKEYTHASHS